MPKRKMNPKFVFAIATVMGVICGGSPAFGELTLADLYAKALATAERIKLAEEQVKISQAGKDKAQAALLPRLTGGGSVARFSEGDSGDTIAIVF